MKKLIFTIIIISCLITSTSKVDASSLSLGVYPPIIKIEVAKPPVDIKTPVIVINNSEETVTLKIIFKPFTASDKENGEVSYFPESQIPPPPDPLLFQRIKVLENGQQTDNIVLSPGQQKQLTLHVDLPKDELLFDYYFSILFVNEPNLDTVNQSSTTQTGAIATNVLLSIGEDDAKGNIEEFSAPLLLEKGPVPFTLRVKNDSKQVINPAGEILIKNMFGQTVGKVDLLPVNILTDTIRAIPDSFQSPDATPPAKMENGKWKMEITPKTYWYETFLLGPYTADLRILLSDQGPVFRRTIYFFALPIQLAIGLIIALLITILIIAKLRKKIS